MAKPEALRPLRTVAAHPEGPAAVVTRRAADRLRAGHMWVYRSDIEQLVPGPEQTELAAGALVTVLDARGHALGTALYSWSSQITLRLVSAEPQLKRKHYLRNVRERVTAALQLRDALAPTSQNSNACRLIFSEADALPGIIADRYNDLVVLQLLTQGTAQQDVREAVVETLREYLPDVRTIVERPDARIRIAEELGPVPDAPLYSAAKAPQPKTQFALNGLHFHFDVEAGQKTGAFLDQRLNYAAAAQYAHGKALDICTYQGGFALHLARRCERVTGVDASRAALEVADSNLLLNPDLPAKVRWIEADAFELLREYETAGKRFDTVVLDPPAFAKSKRAAEGAARGYKELNLRALKMLQPGGTLVTCSCSHHVPLTEFTAIVAAAAADSHRTVQVLEVRGAAPDHPAILTLPESACLKCLICRVS